MTTTLKMPSNYVAMSEEDMTYLYGGAVSLSMSDQWSNKNTCIQIASSLVHRGKFVGDKRATMEVATEIYGHWYAWKWLPKGNSFWQKAANGIDLEDTKDAWYLVAFYNYGWGMDGKAPLSNMPAVW